MGGEKAAASQPWRKQESRTYRMKGKKPRSKTYMNRNMLN